MECNDEGDVSTNSDEQTEAVNDSIVTSQSVAEFFATIREGAAVKLAKANVSKEYSNRIVMPSSKGNGRGGRSNMSSNAAWNNSTHDIREAVNSNDWTSITSLSNTDTVTTLTNKKITNLQANLPEDMRISKLMRQVVAEKDPEQVAQVCKKLRMAIEDTTNGNYIRRSFDLLADTMMRVFKEGPLPSMPDVADVFGLMVWVVRGDFSVYRTWLARMYKVERIRVWVLRSLEFSLRKDEHNRDMRVDTCNRLIELLKEYLENVDNGDHFVAITSVIEQFALNYPKQFQVHFPDIVDIVVGWHLETDQTNSIKCHCSRILQSFQPFWVNDVNFTRNLLGQFLEDMVSYRDEIQQNNCDKDASPPEICFGSIIGCTNSILKCIYDSSASLSQHVGLSLLSELFLCVIDVTQLTIENEQVAVAQNDAIYLGANELTIITLDCMKYGVELPESKLMNVVALQLEHLNTENDSKEKILAILFVVYKLICELKTKVPLTLIRNVLGATKNTIVHRLLFSNDAQIRKAAVRIHHAVLNLKNVEILQEAYRIILKDLNAAMVSIRGDSDSNAVYNQREAEYIISTHLSILSTLAISNSSIIVMWALQPTIFEMLTAHLHTSHYDSIWYQFPETHFAILKLIIAHCRNNNNFIASSSLLNAKMVDVFHKLSLDDTSAKKSTSGIVFDASTASAETSPTSAHFELILKFVANIFAQTKLSHHHILELLDWCSLIISQSSQYSTTLITNNDFKSILELIIRISAKNSSKTIIHKCGDCLLTLFLLEHLNTHSFHAIAEVCCVHMCSVDASIRSLYSHILAKLPLNIALKQVNQFTGIAKSHARSVSIIQHWHTRKPIAHGGGEMRPQFFSNFIKSIKMLKHSRTDEPTDAKDEFVESILQHMFIRSWAHSSDFDVNEEVASIRSDFRSSLEYRTIAVNDIRSVIAWAQWEAAQFCVNNKLRTVLGKPQETFLKIESIIKEDARVLSAKSISTSPDIQTIISNQRNSRILLGFMEALEKSIYNASEGTAIALTHADKPAKTFFHINAPTCNEWFNRIRTAVDWVALNSMEPEMVIRYTEAMLKGLFNTEKTSEPLFDHTLMTHAWALLRNGESNALHGLFTWTKNKTNKKVSWIKFVAEQAAGHFEAAVNGYKIALAPVEESKLDQHVRDFIADQLIWCLYNTQQWHDLREFLHKEESRATPRATMPLLAITTSQIDDIIEYSKSGHSAIDHLTDWDTLETENGEQLSNNFSYNRVIALTENSICKLCLQPASEQVELEEKCIAVVHSGLQECLRTRSREHLNNLIILNYMCNKLSQRNRLVARDLQRCLHIDKCFGSIALMHLLHWSNYFEGAGDTDEQSIIDLRLDVCSMTRKEGNLTYCRQQLDVFFDRMKVGERLNCVEKIATADRLDAICSHMIGNDLSTAGIWDCNMVRGVYETAKWMYCAPEKKEMAIQFAAANTISVRNYLTMSNASTSPVMHESVARSLLKLSEWIQPETERLLASNTGTALVRLVDELDDIRLRNGQSSDIPGFRSISTSVDLAVGKLISSSIQQCPELAKAWGAYGNWCYRWGRKVVELRAETDGLRSIDIASIMALIPSASSSDIDCVTAVLNQHKLSAEDEEIIISNSEEMSSTELIESQLKAIPILSNYSSEKLHQIVEIWRQAHKNVYSFYEMAAEAYFKYLQLTTQSIDDNHIDVEQTNSDNNNGNSSDDCSTVTATLRILRLIVKHALGLQDVLEDGLASTPSTPWKVIIPQLFSRLNHHEPYVRKRVSELLCRVARDSPNLIIFPAVVGAQEHNMDNITDVSLVSTCDDDDDKTSEADANKSSINSALTACFNSLLDTLSKQAAEPVRQVQLLVCELKRITLLWEERWLFTLGQVYSEYVKRLTVFENDVKKALGIGAQESTAVNKDKDKFEKQCAVFREKHRILMRPIVFVIERLHEVTSQKPETANEQAFQERYRMIIDETIGALKQPLSFEQFPQEGWQKFKQLYSVFQQRAQKRSACNLKMTDISPILAELKNTVISMPGIEHSSSHTSSNQQPIHIRSMDNVVHILPTKTKPKKLAFHGSDGRRYTYLFKGLEDLHLDERIMQFLAIANSMMSKSGQSPGQTSKYRAKHYSVIPLGPRSGLISWVDGMTPIFVLYKKWQQREAVNPKKTHAATSTAATANTNTTATANATAANPTILRPSELYYKKLTPLLAKYNLKVTDSRKDWPISVLKEVLTMLTAETPRDLLAKELWCYSTNATEWRQVIRNYSQSIAVMSVIGYVIGLGDRHLDNILIDLVTGEIVHIDYNVCFEKGKTLRVPEKVPFRMTPNLEEALGVTGIEGTFRLACEHVLKTLKRGRETLLTLLEAFVYDPLVDWAVGEDTVGGDAAIAAATATAVATSSTASSSAIGSTVGNRNRAIAGAAKSGSNMLAAAKGPTIVGSVCNATEAVLGMELRQARKQLQQEVTRDTLAIHFIEIRPDWLQNRDGVCNELQQLKSHLLDLQSKRQELQKMEAKRLLLSKQAALITEAESLGTAIRSHPLNTLSQRYGVYKRTRDEYNACKSALLENSNQCTSKYSTYLNFLEQNESQLISDQLMLLTEMTVITKSQHPTHEFELVKEFLDNSAQSTIYVQSCQINSDLYADLLQEFASIKQILETLLQYGAVARYHPKYSHEQHRVAKYADWCRYLSEHRTVQDCRDVVAQFQTSIGKNSLGKIPLQQVVTFAYQLQTIIGDGQYRLQNTLEALNIELNHGDMSTEVLCISRTHEETKCAIKQCLYENVSAQQLLEAVILARLANSNTQFLSMELSIGQTTENLSELTFNGKWFVDELLAQSTSMFDLCRMYDLGDGINHIGNTIANDARTDAPLRAMQGIRSIYIHLCSMNETFFNNTLGDILHGVISEDKSVLSMISAVSSLQEGLPTLAELSTILHLHLMRTSSTPAPTSSELQETDNAALQAMHDARILKSKLNELKISFESGDVCTRGEILFLAFNGMFDKLDECHRMTIDQVQQLIVPGEWEHLDHIKESLELAATILDPTTREILVDIFTVKRLETMIEIFTMALQMACSFKGTGICPVFDDSHLCRPLETYLSNYVWRLMMGIESFVVAYFVCIHIDNEIKEQPAITSIEQLCDNRLSTANAYTNDNNAVLAMCQSLCQNLELSWHKLSVVNHLQQQVARQTGGLRRSQLLLSAHLWLYEEAISTQAGFAIPTPINRTASLVELTKAMQLLAEKKASIQKLSDELNVLTRAIAQRLKWAVGANPGLQPLMDQFNEAISHKAALVDRGRRLADIALKNCTAVLYYEALRVSTVEALEEDQTFLNLVSRWEKSCMMAQTCSSVVTNVEEALVELLDPEGPICPTWLNNVASLIDDMTHQAHAEINAIEKSIIVAQDDVHSCAMRLGALMAVRHRIVADIRSLLRSTIIYAAVKEYFQKYKPTLELISDLHTNAMSKDFTEVMVADALKHIEEALLTARFMYDDLFELENQLRGRDEMDERMLPAIAHIQQQDVSRSNSPSTTGRPKNTKGVPMEQKRNAYAVSVWRRIRMKLEGRDPDPTRRYSTAEQVDWMIREAMDPNNLAVLYEGWTPWV